MKRFLDMLQDHGHITYTTSNRGTEIVMLHYEEWQGYGITDGMSESLEIKELQPHHGMSDGRTDSTADGRTEGKTDGIQEIKHNTSNIEEYINISSEGRMLSGIRSFYVGGELRLPKMYIVLGISEYYERSNFHGEYYQEEEQHFYKDAEHDADGTA